MQQFNKEKAFKAFKSRYPEVFEAYQRQKKYYSEPAKRKARKAVERAVKMGGLIRLPCNRCGNLKSEAHHEDYLFPLSVVWLCKMCHVARHREMCCTRK